jgi:phosphatidylserine decarboxylase
VDLPRRDPLNEYKTMQEFFTRSLKDGARLIDDHPHVLVSPCDGTATSMSTAASTEAMIEQVKGISYPGV